MADSDTNGNHKFNNGSNKQQQNHYQSLGKATSEDSPTVAPTLSDTLCGYGACKPAWIQRLANPVMFTFHAGILLGTNVVAGTYFLGILTTLERQFQLSSSEAAALSIINDIASLSLVLFATYFGHRSHRPRWVASGAILISIGLMCCTLPHFLSEPADPLSVLEGGSGAVKSPSSASSMSGVCDRSSTITNSSRYQLMQEASNDSIDDDVCEGKSSNKIGSVKWIVIGQLIMGVGSAPMWSLTISYIDDAVKKHKFTSYSAFLFIAAMIGPFTGFFLASATTAVYVDFHRIPADQIPDLQIYDPRWIGAWWLGFPLCSLFLVVFAIPMYFYPKVMTVNKQTTESDEPLKADDKGSLTTAKNEGVPRSASGGLIGIVESLKGVFRTLIGFVQNAPFMFLCLGGSAETALVSAQGTFFMKFYQTQFGLSPAAASALMGSMAMPVMVAAQPISALICRRYKLNTKQCAKFIFVCTLVGLVCATASMFIGCPNLNVAGINSLSPSQSSNMAYNEEDVTGTLRSTASSPSTILSTSPYHMQCNNECSCPDEIFRPVCGSDHVSYISPCHAGCTEFNSSGLMQYSNCSCISVSTNSAALIDGGTAVPGLCRDGCNTSSKLILLTIIGMIGLFCTSLTINPGLFIALRVVKSDDRSVALGFKDVLVKCLGFFPAPIFMGAVINSTCILWQMTCGKEGSCWLYDLVAYRYLFMGLAAGLRCVAVVCFGGLVLVTKSSFKNEDEDEKDGQEEMSDLETNTPIN